MYLADYSNIRSVINEWELGLLIHSIHAEIISNNKGEIGNIENKLGVDFSFKKNGEGLNWST